jgi:hypothetical protein
MSGAFPHNPNPGNTGNNGNNNHNNHNTNSTGDSHGNAPNPFPVSDNGGSAFSSFVP